MKLLVGIKHVPDTTTQVKIGADGRRLDESGVQWVISPYDEFALEEALRIRESRTGEVVVVCAGREAAQPTLRQALAVGADRAVLIRDERYERCDGLTRARALAAVARREEPELILVGKYGVGTDEGQTGPMLAELLDWPHAAAVCRLELGERGGFRAEREVEGAVEHIEGRLPAVISCEKGLNEPRYATLKGIMQAKRKPLEIRSPAELGLDTAELDQPKLIWEGLELPPPRARAVLLDGPPREAAERLARILREEAKVI